LLYLVNNLIKETEILKGSSLLAIHIDHNFRRTSAQDVDHCRKWAEKHSIAFSTYRIPWEMPPFSSLVITDRNKEEMGRVARYHAIFKVMKEENADVLLMAHHMDDQVETALMRQHRRKDDNAQTTLLGMAGMRPVRRWGMGNFPPHYMRYFGQEGMSRWICRPLLDFSKVSPLFLRAASLI
jgi:tRNA(Ile)-lysidine synthetase-like protein